MEDQPLPVARTPAGCPDQSGRPQAAGNVPADDPTTAAYMQITPTVIVPASQIHMLLMSVTGIAGIIGAILTAYIATHAPARESDWLLGFAVAELSLAALAELALALTVALRLRLTRGEHGGLRRRNVRLFTGMQPLLQGRDSLRSGVRESQQQDGSPAEGAGG